ncbi:unnamed protein product [Owenia fusiformis]|uniref:Adenosine deaminase domain-containing protein n=1 Tax=Owenia fusiformis TaxID=6347 RepID=A0A8S4P742_OWEFU|nr:unnamed protein product [Owenia fusiformis]
MEFCRSLPKIELHAHINGSISEKTMQELLQKRSQEGSKDPIERWTTTIEKGDKSLDEIFAMFKVIHQISNNTDAAYKITYDIIHEFAEDNVKYVELRTTPRAVPDTGMTKELYLESVLKAIADCEKEDLDIIVKLILAIDRRSDVNIANETVDLAVKYKQISNGKVIGIDLSGDPSVNDARDFIPAFKCARSKGLKLALHLAEVLDQNAETESVLDLPPDRIGHGTFLHPEVGGTESLVAKVKQHKTPLELCLTSNVKGRTVKAFDNHQFKYWYDMGHPCVVCTDDKGVFATSLSKEYKLAAETFDISQQDLYQLSYKAIDHIFDTEDTKAILRQKWCTFAENTFKANIRNLQ